MEDETALTDSEPISSCSVSSLAPHCSSDDLRENAENLGNSQAEEVSKAARTRKLLDKLSRGNQLLHQPKLTRFSENIDLSTPTDHADLFAQQFPHLSKQRPKRLAAASEKSKNGTDAQKRVKEQLSARLAARRRAEQEKRRALYNEDNEDVLGLQDDDEEEEEILEVKKKTKLKKPKPVDSDNSEDDEDYKVEDEEGAEDGDDDSGSTDEEDGENSGDEYEEEIKKEKTSQGTIKESMDLFETENESPMKPLDLPDSLNLPETVPLVPESPTLFPSSLSQWWTGSEKASSSQPAYSQESVVVDDGGGEIAEKMAVAADDLLMFCSGQFDVASASVVPASKPVEIPAEEKETSKKTDAVEEEDEDVPVRHAPSKKRAALESDDEEEGVSEELKKEEVEVEQPQEQPEEEERKGGNRRAVLLSDDESDEEQEEQEGQEEDEGKEESEEEEEEKESEKEEEDGGSDDELAMFKRLERQEYKKKVKLDTFVDEEADLSGDDVGSDADEDGEGNNEYEAEECDAEQFDTDDLKRKNHKLFLKQEQQEIHRDIAKLQDRLLADGDLAGVETNRSFRVKLRTEEETIDFSDLNEFSQDSSIAEEEAVEDEKQRAEAIKFKVEMQQKIALQQAEDPFDDLLEVAASAALKAETTVTETRVAPTLLGKAPLANVIKDLNGGIVVKQLYTSTADSAGTKRPSDATGNVAKKHKLNLLDSLDD